MHSLESLVFMEIEDAMSIIIMHATSPKPILHPT